MNLCHSLKKNERTVILRERRKTFHIFNYFSNFPKGLSQCVDKWSLSNYYYF